MPHDPRTPGMIQLRPRIGDIINAWVAKKLGLWPLVIIYQGRYFARDPWLAFDPGVPMYDEIDPPMEAIGVE